MNALLANLSHAAAYQGAVWALLGLFAVLGVIALVSPRCFRGVASHGARWIATEKLVELFDRRYDVDHLILPHSRWLGAAVLAAVATLGVVLWRL